MQINGQKGQFALLLGRVQWVSNFGSYVAWKFVEILFEIIQGKWPIRRPRRKWEGNIRMDLE
jgi:hypothetical protein